MHFTHALTYPVLISSLEIAGGDVTLVLRPVMYKVQDEYGAVKKTLKGNSFISTVLISLVVVVLP